MPPLLTDTNQVRNKIFPKNQLTPVLLLAPFRGITHKAYRNAFAKHIGGIDVFYAPFISGPGTGRIHSSKLSDILPVKDNTLPTVPQVISNNAREIVELGNMLFDQGYKHLNLNMGCPFSRIANKKRGCGMLPYPEEVDHMLSEVSGSLKTALSVKTRLGFLHPEEIMKILEVLNQYPIQHIILHPRTGKQLYSGKANPQWYAECLRKSRHPLIYNGDIYNLSQYKRLQKMFPKQAEWMLGRGALINPFLATEILGKPISNDEKRVRLLSFHNEVWKHTKANVLHEQKRIGSMKAIWQYMAGIMAKSEETFFYIKRSNTDKEYQRAVKRAIEQDFANEKQIESYFYKLTKQRSAPGENHRYHLLM